MKIKHRKLYPSSKDNSTIPCPDICVSSCPYGCDPFTDIYYDPPPPPSISSPSSNSAQKGDHISPYVFVIVALVAGCSIFVTFYLLFLRFRFRWNSFRSREGRRQARNEDFLDENHGPTAIDYPIWYINTIGLQPSVIDSIAIFRYKEGDSFIEGTECAICLNEFQNDDTLRLLPKCSHAFHIPCIDTWLRSHINCPVCRAGIISSIATSTPMASNPLSSHNSIRPNEDSQVENSGNGEVLNVNQAREEDFHENRTETGEIIEVQQVDQEEGRDLDIVKVNKNPKETSASKVTEDNSNDRRIINGGNNLEDQPVRRSVSVDAVFAPEIRNITLCLSENIDDASGSEDQNSDSDSSKNVSENFRTIRSSESSSLVTQLLHKRPVRMKRSFSYSGRSLVSRQHSRNNSLLPL